jgi:hypothetical protein
MMHPEAVFIAWSLAWMSSRMSHIENAATVVA